MVVYIITERKFLTNNILLQLSKILNWLTHLLIGRAGVRNTESISYLDLCMCLRIKKTV